MIRRIRLSLAEALVGAGLHLLIRNPAEEMQRAHRMREALEVDSVVASGLPAGSAPAPTRWRSYCWSLLLTTICCAGLYGWGYHDGRRDGFSRGAEAMKVAIFGAIDRLLAEDRSR